MGQNFRRIVLKNCRYGGGVKNSEKLPTSFMDGPTLKNLATHVCLMSLMIIGVKFLCCQLSIFYRYSFIILGQIENIHSALVQ